MSLNVLGRTGRSASDEEQKSKTPHRSFKKLTINGFSCFFQLHVDVNEYNVELTLFICFLSRGEKVGGQESNKTKQLMHVQLTSSLNARWTKES
jgi:hypothetical protein